MLQTGNTSNRRPALTKPAGPKVMRAGERLGYNRQMIPLALSAFTGIERGMSLERIRERLGTPEKTSTMGAHVLEYKVTDGSKIEILYVHPQLMRIIHYRNDGTKMSWVPSVTHSDRRGS